MLDYKKTSEYNKKDIASNTKSSNALTKDLYIEETLQKMKKSPQCLTYSDVIQLQKSIGNKAVCQLINEIYNDDSLLKPIPKKENNTGMPDDLKTGIENLSGVSMDKVRVHYNSNKPMEVGATAYTQGTNIHVAPGATKHLPHEAWHVVQQSQGRVKPTTQLKGIAINDNKDLEKEADNMGIKASALKSEDFSNKNSSLVDTTKLEDKVTQCAMYLFNGDSNVYKDSDDDTLEFAYVSSGEHLSYFINYYAVQKIQNNATLMELSKISDRTLQKCLDDILQGIKPNYRGISQKDWTKVQGELQTDVGVIKMINTKTNVITVCNNPILVSKVIFDTFMHGAQCRPEYGGGSRLPRGKGYFFYRNDLNKNWLEALGLTAEDFAGIKIKALPSNFIEATLNTAKMERYNYYEYYIDKASTIPDAIYVSEVISKRANSSRFTCNGVNYDEMFTNITQADSDKIDASFKSLTKPNATTGWVEGKNINKVGRGDGQASAMDKWNALGAVAWANYKYGCTFDLNQNWEWLHIRGAQLGGETTGGNLIPGLFVTNSYMIPYENMILKWATDDPTKFWVKFDSIVNSNVFTTQIYFYICAKGHKTLGNFGPNLLVTFDPLRGSLVDKVAGQFLKHKIDQTCVIDDSMELDK